MEIKRILVGGLLVAWGFCFSAAARCEEAGDVMLAAGKAYVEAAGATRAAAAGMKVSEGESLRTGENGYLYIQTRDGGFFVLRPNSSAKVVVFRFDPKEPAKSQVKIQLAGGVARVVTGEAARQARQNFRMNTPVAAIGVRGTDFTVFADDAVTRASVQSGGIIVESFSNGCSPVGNGPCGSEFAKVLMAGNETLVVEVQRGDKQPRLLKSEQLQPDRVAPPGPNEPAPKNTAAAAPADAQYVASNTPVTRPLPEARPVDAAPATPTTPAAPTTPTAPEVPPPVVTPTPEPAPPPRLITWGRWQAIADLPADTDLATAGSRQLLALNKAQALFRDNSEKVVLPNEGSASFVLREHEGHFFNDVTGQVIPAAASNGSLSIDFGRRTFATSLDVAGGGLSAQVKATGLVGNDGKFQSNALAPASISGALGGSDAREAGYLYHKRINNQVIVDGATYWTR